MAIKKEIIKVSDYSGAKKVDGVWLIKQRRSPSEIVSAEKCFAFELTMSCGGGMGGSRWEEYVRANTIDKFVGMVGIDKFDTILGDRILLNAGNIVEVRRVQIIKMLVDVRPWKYYGGRHENIEDFEEEYIVLKENDEFKVGG